MGQETNQRVVIEAALHAMHANMTEDTGMAAIAAICDAAAIDTKLFVPMDIRALSPDEDLSDPASIPMSYHILKDEEGNHWMCAFTAEDEVRKIPGTLPLQLRIADLLSTVSTAPALAGLVINPFGEMIQLHQDLIHGMLDAIRAEDNHG